MTPASFGIVDFRAVAHQARGADDAERAREAGADHEHHDRADDGEDDLRLDDRRLPVRRALAAAAGTPARSARPAAIGSRDSACLRSRTCSVERRRALEHVGALAVLVGCSIWSVRRNGLRERRQRRSPATIAIATKRLRTLVIGTPCR